MDCAVMFRVAGRVRMRQCCVTRFQSFVAKRPSRAGPELLHTLASAIFHAGRSSRVDRLWK